MNPRVDPRKQKRLARKARGDAKGAEPGRVASAVASTQPSLQDGCPTLRFEPMDTWFFRESRPMEAIGGSELASVFPPPPRTLLGAVRTAIGDASGVDWKDFKDDPEHPLRKLIGFGDDLGTLGLFGPWLHWRDDRLFPVPLFLLSKEREFALLRIGQAAQTMDKPADKPAMEFARLRIGQAAQTHLGQVRLPELPGDKQGYKPLEQAWITRVGLEAMLIGEVPDANAIQLAKALFQYESRLGIARDNVRRITDEGLLYQTRHLRPNSDLTVEAGITLTEDTAIPSGLVRLGGEGRMAHLVADKAPPFLIAPNPTRNTKGLILLLLTPARFVGRDGWLPPGLRPEDERGERVWKGQIAEVDLTLHAAVLGKAQREGGWDMANHRPRAVQSLIPAGSAYYVTVGGDIKAAIQKLHNTCNGEDQPLGRGLLACGLWNANEF